jgi:hypothetical protein
MADLSIVIVSLFTLSLALDTATLHVVQEYMETLFSTRWSYLACEPLMIYTNPNRLPSSAEALVCPVRE